MAGLTEVELRVYTDADFWLTEALETDPTVMSQLGGPIQRERLPDIHARRLDDPWWFKVVAGGEPAGTIGIWETEHTGDTIHETGWMVLPAHQGKGIASAALRELIERVRREPAFPSMHAFPPTTNAPSNALCRKFGFAQLGESDVVYAGRTLHVNHWMLETT